MSLMNTVKDFVHKVDNGQMMEAFEQYYADDVELIEATGETFKGKDTQRKRLAEWGESIEEFHGSGTTAITVNEESGHAMIETWGDMTFKGGGRMRMEEVQVQKWENGQIVHERFYYNMPG